MSVNPIFPAGRAELKAFASVSVEAAASFFIMHSRSKIIFLASVFQVLDVACVDSRATYEKTKAGRFSPAVADVAGSSVCK